MIRQTHSYLLGAVSGTALVAVAVVAFVLLVSAQALRSWPIGALGLGGDNSGSVSPARPASRAAAGRAAKTTASSRSAAKGGSAGGIGDPSPQPEVAARAPGGQSAPSSPAAPALSQQPSRDSLHAGSGPNPVTSGGGGSGSTGTSGNLPGSVTDTVNDAAAPADEALGGALSESGVTKVTEKATEGVSGVAGPNSALGQTVNEVAGTVDGLLGRDR